MLGFLEIRRERNPIKDSVLYIYYYYFGEGSGWGRMLAGYLAVNGGHQQKNVLVILI